jgi:DNA-binding response OmpR family regulator
MAAVAGELSQRAQSPDPSGAPKRLRVLVADDERDTVATLIALLADDGCQVRGVYKGRDVIPAVRDFAPDAIVLDLAMPDVSGWELAREIRRRSGEQQPVLIAISGRYKQAADKLLGELVGFDHHLTKPCDPKALLALLATLMPQRQSGQAPISSRSS